MAVKTDEVRDLVDFVPPEGFLVTSFYLDVNAAEFPAPTHVQKSFDSAIHTAEDRRKEIEDGLSHDAAESVRGDLAAIRDYMEHFERNDANGLAIFSCSAEGFWQDFSIPTSVSTQVAFEPRPQVAQLATFLSHSKATAILLTDREQARIFTMKEGDVREWTSFEDFVPQRSEAGGWSQNRYQRRSDSWAKHHIDHAAELVRKLEQHYPFDWLILGTDEEAQATLEEGLHPYVKDLVIGRIRVRIDAPTAEVIEKAREVREEAESNLIDQLMNQAQELAGAGGRGTVGLQDTLGALNEQKVNILVVQEGYRQPGSVCLSCGMLYAEELEVCPACGEEAHKVEDVVEPAIQRGFELGSRVEVATEYEKLEPIGYIGSILYY
jgi:peptide subunit release factor 1 (eRF1)